MPILGAVVLLIQICFAYHAVKTGLELMERGLCFDGLIEEESVLLKLQ